MAIKKINEEYTPHVGGYTEEFICDTEKDVANLPTALTGSMAMVASDGMPIYMVNASGEWVKVC